MGVLYTIPIAGGPLTRGPRHSCCVYAMLVHVFTNLYCTHILLFIIPIQYTQRQCIRSRSVFWSALDPAPAPAVKVGLVLVILFSLDLSNNANEKIKIFSKRVFDEVF